MATIKRVIVNKGDNKVDFVGNIPSPADNNNVKVIDLEKNVPTPVTNEISTGNTTLRFTNIQNAPQKPQVVVKAGTYSTAFVEGGDDVTYTLEKVGNLYKVKGTIKYMDANAAVGLAAGNHVILDFAYPGMTKAALPAGTIVKVTHTEIEGNYNTATKDAFETDGSLVVAFNVSTAASLPLTTPREVKVAWKTDAESALVWETYIIDFSEAELGAAA